MDFDLISVAGMFSDNPWIICLSIFLFTFVLEDVATVSAALLASYGYVPPQMAFICLVMGIILGDLGLYGLGFLASKFEWAKRLLDHKQVKMVNNWLGKRKTLSVVAARFVPGARLPTYTAMGFFNFSFIRFVVAVVIASVVWTSLLFTAIYFLGEVFVDEFNEWKWPIALSVIVTVIFLPRIIHKVSKAKEKI